MILRTLPLTLASALALSGCAAGLVPGTGPGTGTAVHADRAGDIDVVELSAASVAAANGTAPVSTFAALPSGATLDDRIGLGQTIEVVLYESAPAVLLPGGGDLASGLHGGQLALPAQGVNYDGTINVPFVGRIPVVGRRTSEVEERIAAALHGKANQIQVLVRITSQSTQKVTVIGDVVRGTRLDLSAKGERLLDAIAAAGGATGPIEKATVQLSRGRTSVALPLEAVVRDPAENVTLAAGDVVTVYNQPKSFIAMGAVGKPSEVTFEATGLNLAQALARAGGALDARADPSGVFVFRARETKPVIYRVDLRQPAAVFVLRAFRVEDGDVVYVSNSPLADLQKFLNVLGSAVYPFDAAHNFVR